MEEASRHGLLGPVEGARVAGVAAEAMRDGVKESARWSNL